MKKIVVILVIAAFMFSLSSAVYAKTAGDKLVRGAGNVLSGWLEVPKTMGDEWKSSKNAFAGCFFGFFKGVGIGAIRTISGAWDVITFPIPVPYQYEPLYKPDYVFDAQPDGSVGGQQSTSK